MERRSFCAARSSPDCTSRIATPSCPPYSPMVRVSDDTASLRAGTTLPTGLVRSPFTSGAEGGEAAVGEDGEALGKRTAADADGAAEEADEPAAAAPPGGELQ